MTYTSEWASQNNPPVGGFTTTGIIAPTYSWLDELFHWFMHSSHIRAGALAVINGSDVLVHRGYTLAESGYPSLSRTVDFDSPAFQRFSRAQRSTSWRSRGDCPGPRRLSRYWT
jgi:hypothetical protein